MDKLIRIGTRESQLAVWQAKRVQELLKENNFHSELVYIKSEGDIDLQTPLYEMGVQGIFTKSLDIALLNNKIDIAVHSMKDVPTQLAKGITQAAVLERASYRDILVYKDFSVVNSELSIGNKETSNSQKSFTTHHSPLTNSPFTIATSSIRRKSQWLNRYPDHLIENLRGNVNTRLRKVEESNWQGAIFAAAGLERIGVRPEKSIELEWMLPAPAQGAIMVVCRDGDTYCAGACAALNDEATAICTKAERDFLRELLGGCSTPISALAEIKNSTLYFRGNILSLDGKKKVEVDLSCPQHEANGIGIKAANELLQKGGKEIADEIRNAGK